MSNTLEKVDQLGEKLIDLASAGVDKVPDTLQKLMGFVETQAPLLMGDIITYGKVMAVAKTLGWLLTIVPPVLFWIKFSKENKIKGSDHFEWVAAAIATSILCFGISIAYVVHINQIILPWFAPRLYLLNYLSDLIHNNRG